MLPIDLHTVLVANRGEIARRVIRTCRRLGIRSVAIFTDLDAPALHVREADEALRVSSYLDIDAVVAAARASGADAVHPGYGFLSERAEFARALEETGIKLVGPSSTVMDRMGRKDAAREIAVAAGVPVVPSYPVGFETVGFETVAAQPPQPPAAQPPHPPMAFPVLVKAAAGGGGKGMRIVRDASEYDAALAAARREALSSFGDDTMLVEKYVEHGRHLEVQVLGDAHGNVVHLFERDCSTQRRHQKVIEEAPAPDIDAGLRERLTSAAVALARHVGYEGAGTVEFLLDADTGEAYFLEMNTRLQVEHPVTEAICGDLDLVEHQLRVAAGEPLALRQEELAIHGHAIEVRVYAEDSFGGFLPQAGTATLVRWPEGVRVDHALESGQVVSTSYDPMLGKIVVHGADRESARRALVTALDDTAILGLTTNAGFLRALAASDEFRDATIDTAWLDTATIDPPGLDVPRVFAAWTQAMLAAEGHLPGGLDAGHPFHADGFRLGAAHAPQTVELDRPVVVDRAAGTVGDEAVRELSAERHVVVLSIEGRREQAVVDATAHAVEVVHRGQRHVFTRPDPFLDHVADAGDGTILAPMPGTVLTIDVVEGDTVAEGDVLATMEAMKMELTLRAPFAGTVTAVEASVGGQVPLGARLLVVEPPAPAADAPAADAPAADAPTADAE